MSPDISQPENDPGSWFDVLSRLTKPDYEFAYSPYNSYGARLKLLLSIRANMMGTPPDANLYRHLRGG